MEPERKTKDCILLLPYKFDFTIFNSLVIDRKKIVGNIKGVYWLSEQAEPDPEKEHIINNIRHLSLRIPEFVFDHHFNSANEFFAFSDHLNPYTLSIIETLSELKIPIHLFFFNYKTREYEEVNDLELFARIYDQLSVYAEVDKADSQYIVKFPRDYSIFKETYKSISRKTECVVYYKEKFFFNKFFEAIENKYNNVLGVSAEILLKEGNSLLHLSSKVLFIRGFNNLDLDDQDYLIKKIRQHLKKHMHIFYECGDIVLDKYIQHLISHSVWLPDTEQLWQTISPWKFLNFLIHELANENRIQVQIRPYTRLYGDTFLKDLLFSKYAFSDILKAMSMTLRMNVVLDIYDINLWYSILKNVTATEPDKIISLPEVDAELQQEKLSPYRIENKGVIIKIIFNNRDIDYVGGKRIGWKYISFLVRNSSEEKRYGALDLYNKIHNRGTDLNSFGVQSKIQVEIIDKKALKEAIENLKTLEILINKEKKPDRLEKLKQERDKLQKIINSSSRLIEKNGKKIRVPKKTESAASQKRRTIRQTIIEVLEPLEEKDLEAYIHFKRHLHLGDEFFYSKPKDLDWE